MLGINNTKIKDKYSSIQIWYESNDSNTNVCLDVDINLWRLNSPKHRAYFDIGLLIRDIAPVNKVYIYFPFDFEHGNIVDLSEKLKTPEMVQGVFNEDYFVKADTKETIVLNSNGERFRICFLDNKSEDIKVEKKYDGTLVSFDVRKNEEDKSHRKSYYRFRIKDLKSKKFFPFIEHYKPKNSFFESAFIETEMIDVRINEKRNQNRNLIDDIKKVKQYTRFVLTKVNFFVITSENDDVMSDGINMIYKRQLETGNFWTDYLENSKCKKMSVYKSNSVKYNKRQVFTADDDEDEDNKNNNKNNNSKNIKNKNGNDNKRISYNYKEKDCIDDFSCFVKVKYRKCNIGTVFIYLLALFVSTLILSIICGVIYDSIKEYIFNFFGMIARFITG